MLPIPQHAWRAHTSFERASSFMKCCQRFLYLLSPSLNSCIYCVCMVDQVDGVLKRCWWLWPIFFRGEMPKLGDIENVHKKRAHDRDSRLATVMVSNACSWLDSIRRQPNVATSPPLFPSLSTSFLDHCHFYKERNQLLCYMDMRWGLKRNEGGGPPLTLRGFHKHVEKRRCITDRWRTLRICGPFHKERNQLLNTWTGTGDWKGKKTGHHLYLWEVSTSIWRRSAVLHTGGEVWGKCSRLCPDPVTQVSPDSSEDNVQIQPFFNHTSPSLLTILIKELN